MGAGGCSCERGPVEVRAIDIPTGLLVAVAALCCSVVLGCAFVLLAGGDVLPGSAGAAAWWAAAGLASANVAALIGITRSAGGLRPGALAVAWVLAFVWPLSGFPFTAALIATAGTGLAAAWGAGGRAGTRAAALLAVVALELMTVAFAAAPDGAAPYRPEAAARAAETSSAPARSPSPADGPASSPRRVSPARVVRAYYGALDRRDFGRAWRRSHRQCARASAASSNGARASARRSRASRAGCA